MLTLRWRLYMRFQCQICDIIIIIIIFFNVIYLINLQDKN